MRLAISGNEIMEGDIDWQVREISDFYLLKLIQKANELGLKNKRIKKIVKIEPTFMSGFFIDFICD